MASPSVCAVQRLIARSFLDVSNVTDSIPATKREGRVCMFCMFVS
jgi:hypothetical protein